MVSIEVLAPLLFPFPQVRILCTQLLNNYPAARDFTLVILNTLTELSLATLVDIPSQVSLVLNAGYSDIETG